MHSMQSALEDLVATRDNYDQNITFLHQVIRGEESTLAQNKKRLQDLMERSSSLSQTISFVQAGMANEEKDSQEATTSQKFEPTDDEVDQILEDFPASQDLAIIDLARALIQTRDYVQPSVLLPSIEGWSWYDALKKHAPGLLQEVLDSEHRAQLRLEEAATDIPQSPEDNIVDDMPDTSKSKG